MGIKSQPLWYTKKWVKPILRCTSSNISITKVQPPSTISITTVSHQKAISKDFAYSEKFIK